jgi:hypothetical protein
MSRHKKRQKQKWSDRLLYRFDKWFSSGAGVWQTLVACIVIVVVEIVWPSLDPHWFWLLVFLTVYSAVTQPALAQSGAATAAEIRKLALEIKKIAEAQKQELEEDGEILEDVRHILKDVHGK